MQKRHQILKLNGLDADCMGYDEVKAMVDVLIDDAIEEFKFEKKEIFHKTFPKLDMLYYMKGSEKVREYHENKEYLNKSADLKGKDVKALESGEIDPEKINIKIENPEYISFKSRLKVLQSGKSRFAGVLDKCKDVGAWELIHLERWNRYFIFETLWKLLISFEWLVGKTECKKKIVNRP